MSSYEPIGAVLRGLEVLRSLNDNGPMAIGDLFKATQITKPTLVRLIETLQYAGYVGQADEHRRYTVTAKVLTLGNGYRGESHLLAVAGPLLNSFREKIGWPSEIGIFDHDAMIIFDVGRNQGGFRFINGRPGHRLPLLRTAMGKAFLGFMDAGERDLLLSQLRKIKNPDYDLARKNDELRKILKQVRSKGYSVSDQETLETVRGLGAPILQDGKPVAAINLIVLATAMTLKEAEKTLAPALMEVAERIGSELSTLST